VRDNEKDVFMMYITPHNKKCEELAVIWEKFAEYVKDLNTPDIIIGKMDAKNNHSEGVDIKHYPELIWYPKNNKVGVSCKYAHTMEGLKKFMQDNSSSYREAVRA